MSEVTYQVPEMHCGACRDTVQTALGGVEGVRAVNVDLDTKAVRVAYDETVVSENELRARIERTGFDVAGAA